MVIKLLKFLIIFLLLSVLIVGGYALFLFKFNYSEGFRVGTIGKFSQKGFVFKTWEGQMRLMQGVTQDATGTLMANDWSFSVLGSQEPVIAAINQASTYGHPVKLFYKEKIQQIGFLGDTQYFVYKVEELKR